ncbi:type II secretion system minor pseudopilin GspI [Marinobacter salinisoli]|uniref:Type II secretion system protein I n=1 Tax=Marinobacter salinisoli TaxID=2769486 RepID=A0ABX7MNV5_9GAMM|nr:type II secretion system minor pseudopilin GspI [Marinobacter salinisoli]QSP93955.1 type II secretion system minor pseudopilin GspI [Marinobacter salinisoli]
MKRQAGFTLIEVLVALLVFALVATAAADVGGQYISSFERIRDKTLAAWLADNRISQLRLQEDLPGISENAQDLDYGPYEWQVTTRVLATEDPSIRRVEVVVARYRDAGTEPAPIHTLMAFLGEH